MLNTASQYFARLSVPGTGPMYPVEEYAHPGDRRYGHTAVATPEGKYKVTMKRLQAEPDLTLTPLKRVTVRSGHYYYRPPSVELDRHSPL